MGRRRPYRRARKAQEAVMTAIGRRSILVASLLVPMAHIPLALAVDALPDARFVGFAQAVNDFDLASGQMALQRSANENIRGYATRIIADANYDASALSKSSAEAGVSYAPDGSMGPKTQQPPGPAQHAAGPGVRHGLRPGPALGADRLRGAVRRLFAERQERSAQALCPERLAQGEGTPGPGAPAGRRPLRPVIPSEAA